MLEGGPLMLVVFLILGLVIAVYVISRNVKTNKQAILLSKTEKTTSEHSSKPEALKTEGNNKTDEEIAAFMALHLYLSQTLHDKESNVLTIERIQKRYSPWSSKIYSMNNILNK